MTDILKMVGAGLIAGGITSTLIGALAAMTWGRLMDRFTAVEKLEGECRTRTDKCLSELFEKTGNHEVRITVLEEDPQKKT